MIFTSIFQRIKEPLPLYFRFWANCILVKGYNKGMIFDLQRGRNVSVSRLFCETYEKHKDETVNSISRNKSFANRLGYLKMLDFFVKNDFGILTDDTQNLPELSMEYDSPFWITNLILEVDSDQDPEMMFSVIEKAAKGQVQAIQINDFGHITPRQLKKIADIVTDSPLQCLNIYTFYVRSYSYKQLAFMQNNSRFRNLTIMGAPRKRSFENKEFGLAKIQYIRDLVDYDNCGNVRNDLFVFNQPFFIEANSCNTCLNRKISIDRNGIIRNCPLMERDFGNIKDYSIKEIVHLTGFKDLWNITKDQIDVCKDCEFRYICTDCRHFIKDKNNIHSQPSKCKYNPYIGKWENEEGYVPVEECGFYSRETGFVPDHEKIRVFNEKTGT